MAFEYLDNCVGIMSDIRSSGLNLYPTITHYDETGSTKLASIGTFDRGEGEIPVCVKYQDIHGTLGVHNRMSQELHVVSLLYDRVTQLRSRLPLFIGQISVEGRVIAVITEDVTNNGTEDIWPTDVSENDMEILVEAFPDDPDLGSAFSGNVLQRTMAFDVGGQDRWLDFTPNPFYETYLQNINHREAVFDRSIDLTWEIGSIKELGILDAHFDQE